MSVAEGLAAPGTAPATDDGPKSLWIGDLAYWMDENFVLSQFAMTGECTAVKVIRNKLTGYGEGYGFVDFRTNYAAQKVLEQYSGQPMPGFPDVKFRLNWASGLRDPAIVGTDAAQAAGEEHSVFVGDVGGDVTDFVLLEAFKQYYPSVKGARVVLDPQTGRPKGYGFVRFTDLAERDRAIVEMNGQLVGSRQIRVDQATPKRNGAAGGGASSLPAASPWGVPGAMGPPGGMPGASGGAVAMQPQSEEQNTTLFIGGVHAAVTEEEVRQSFGMYGELVYAKVVPAKACAFVQYVTRESAEQAMVGMQGQPIGRTNAFAKISWGKQQSRDYHSQLGGPMAGRGPGPQPRPGQAAQQAQHSAYSAYGGGFGGYYGAVQAGYAHDASAAYYGAQPGYAAMGAMGAVTHPFAMPAAAPATVTHATPAAAAGAVGAVGGAVAPGGGGVLEMNESYSRLMRPHAMPGANALLGGGHRVGAG